MKTSIICLSLLIVYLHKGNCFSFSDSFAVCHRNDPKLDACLSDAIEKGFKLLGSTGLPAIGVPSIDPLKITKIVIGAGTSAVNLVQKYYNASLLGLSSLKVENAHFDFEKGILSYTTKHPTIVQKANYEVDGKIMVLPVYGKGYSIISFKDAVLKHDIHFDKENKDNKLYFKVKVYTAKITVGGAHFDFQNLFNGDKRLGDNIINVLNENWRAIVDDVTDGVNNSFSKVFEAVAKIFFSKIPVDDMFPN